MGSVPSSFTHSWTISSCSSWLLALAMSSVSVTPGHNTITLTPVLSKWYGIWNGHILILNFLRRWRFIFKSVTAYDFVSYYPIYLFSITFEAPHNHNFIKAATVPHKMCLLDFHVRPHLGISTQSRVSQKINPSTYYIQHRN